MNERDYVKMHYPEDWGTADSYAPLDVYARFARRLCYRGYWIRLDNSQSNRWWLYRDEAKIPQAVLRIEAWELIAELSKERDELTRHMLAYPCGCESCESTRAWADHLRDGISRPSTPPCHDACTDERPVRLIELDRLLQGGLFVLVDQLAMAAQLYRPLCREWFGAE